MPTLVFKPIPQDFEPKLQNRFIVELPKEFNIESNLIQAINLPKFSYGEWQDIRIKFFDPSSSEVTLQLLKLVDKIKAKKNMKFTFKLQFLDAVGVAIDQWEISVSGIRSIDFVIASPF